MDGVRRKIEPSRLGSKIEFTEYTLKFLMADTERTQVEREG
jgi:hypothetical protein